MTKQRRAKRIPFKRQEIFLKGITQSVIGTHSVSLDDKTNVVIVEGLKEVRIVPKPIRIEVPDSTIYLTVETAYEQPVTTTIAVDFEVTDPAITHSFQNKSLGPSEALTGKFLSVVSTIRVGVTSEIRQVSYFLELKENNHTVYRYEFDEKVVENAIQFSHIIRLI